MFRSIKRAQKYFGEYILQVRWIKIAITPTLLALILGNYLEVVVIGAASSFINGNAEENALRNFCLSMFVYATLHYSVSIFETYFISYSVRRSYYNFFKEYLEIKFSDFQKFGVGEAQYNINRRSNSLYLFFSALTLTFLSNACFFLIATYSVMLRLSLGSALKVIVVVMLFLSATIYSQSIRSKIRRNTNDGLENNSKKLYDILLNYERIKAYNNAGIESQKYYDSMEYQVKYGTIFWATFELARYLNNALYALVACYIIYEFNRTSSDSADGVKLVVLVGELSNKIRQMAKDIDMVCTHFTNLDHSLIADCVPEIKVGTLEIPTIHQGFKIKNLKFCFNSKKVFQNVYTEINHGEKIAITGVNGGGKSTFVKLLMGLYDEYQGSIEIDGYESSAITRKSLRGVIGYVPQTSQIFDTTVIENLQSGNTEISEEKIVELCKMYNYHTLFKSVGYKKLVGERGKNLSGGQKQKISFMRAVLKNAPVLILDEATSNLDNKSESEIVSNIIENMPEKTVIMIVHNLETLKYFDKVLFFSEHTLKAQGRFKDLYAQKKDFYRFYNFARNLKN